MSKPSVLFVCVHNAGRSQMAAAFLTHLSDGAVEVRSAGSAPADQINPAAVQAMAEVGIDITAEKPKILTDQAVRESDVVITMGCGDTCPFYPGKRYEDWVLDDPAGQGVDAVRPIRDEIRRRVEVTHRRTRRRLAPKGAAMHVVMIGGSDAGISAALRVRELDPSVEVTVVVADAYPNFSICGIPYYISGEVGHWSNLAHRSRADLEATGMRLLLDTLVTDIDVAGHQVSLRGVTACRSSFDTTRWSSGRAPFRSGRRSTAWTNSAQATAFMCCTPWVTRSRCSKAWMPSTRGRR